GGDSGAWAKDALDDTVEFWVVLLQLGARVGWIGLPGRHTGGIRLEVEAYAFGPVLFDIADHVGPRPQARPQRLLVDALHLGVKGGIDAVQPHILDGVGKLVDQYVLAGPPVAGVAEQIFLADGEERDLRRRADPTRPRVPVYPGE